MNAEHVKRKWRLKDIIDLEYLFYRDAVSQSAENQQDLHERDRNIFFSSFRSDIEKGHIPKRQFIIKAWLNRRREEESAKGKVLPGESFEELNTVFRVLFILKLRLFALFVVEITSYNDKIIRILMHFALNVSLATLNRPSRPG